MNTDTTNTDVWEAYCDECYYHMWRLRRKTERGWHDGFHIHTGEEAKGLCETLNKLERERDEARETIAATLRAWQTAQEKIITVTAHRDEAREVLKMTQEAWVKAKAERVDALRERDEARAESIRWQSIAEGRGRTDEEEESDCSVCRGCFMIAGTEPNDDVMNTPCPKCNGHSEDTEKTISNLIRERDEAQEEISREKIALTMFCSTLGATIDKAGRMAFKEGAAKVAREQIEAAYAIADLWISYRRTNQNEL